NKEEVKRKNNEFRLKYPNKVKSYKLKQSYGISLKEYNSLKKAQNNLCAICNKRPETRVTKKYRLCVDHNHATGKVRGLLCFGCNSALGYVNENKDIIKNMIKYLDLHR
ncbi:MAG TPA: endonuclease VII domain-containing protein, partial [Aquella sp.]|nr:endonuclease VII domain-containing protein [Aquella sp.]